MPLSCSRSSTRSSQAQSYSFSAGSSFAQEKTPTVARVSPSITRAKPRHPLQYGGHQPNLPQYQAVIRGSLSGVYQLTRCL